MRRTHYARRKATKHPHQIFTASAGKNLSWLKKTKSVNAEGEKVIKKVLKKYKKILILGDESVGKDIVKGVCLNYFNAIGKQPVILPSLNLKTLGSFFNSGTWKNYSKILNQNYPTLCAISHEQSAFNVEKYFNKFKTKFDAIIDTRTLPNGKKLVYQVLVKSANQWKAIYLNEQYILKFGPKLIAA